MFEILASFAWIVNSLTQPLSFIWTWDQLWDNLNLDEDDGHDDDDYLVSNSYVEESLDEDDSVDGISDTDNEVPDMIPPSIILFPKMASHATWMSIHIFYC